MRYLFSKIAGARFGKVYADLALMEDSLRDSGLDWTVVRPPQLTDKPLTGRYRTAYGQNIRGGWSVPAPTSPTSCSACSVSPRRSTKSSESPASACADRGLKDVPAAWASSLLLSR
jgi:hypothetical protein